MSSKTEKRIAQMTSIDHGELVLMYLRLEAAAEAVLRTVLVAGGGPATYATRRLREVIDGNKAY